MTGERNTRFGPLLVRYDAALRPRPWTRMQSSWAADLLGTLPEGPVLELCAGAGQIGLLALVEADARGGRGSQRHVVQVDANEAVCGLARLNAAAAGLAGRVDVRRGRPEQCLERQERFALVLADPPWVPSGRVPALPEDPPTAIDGGPDGLDVVRALLPEIEHHLDPSGAALLQVGGPDQVERVREILASRGSALHAVEFRLAPVNENGAVVLLVPAAGPAA